MSDSASDHESEEAVKQVMNSAESFATDFHKSLAGKTDGNFVCSPFSAYLVLAMAAYGAEGTTEEEMRRALHLPENDELAYQGFQSIIDILNIKSDIIIKLANKIYCADDLKIKKKFQEITSKYFHSESSTLNFKEGAESVKVVNQWCSDKTNGKIKNMVSKNDINSNTKMILLNAVYFKGNWMHKFSGPDTQIKPFHVNKTTTIDVPTMHMKKIFFYAYLEYIDAEVISLDYKDDDWSLVIIVPKQIDGLKEIEDNLDKIRINRNREKVCLALPMFKIDTEIDFNVYLDELGMSDMFTDGANFKGIADEPLNVDTMRQKAFIEVNEEGSTAVATFQDMIHKCKRSPPPVQLLVDRPFFYKIVYKGNTLFSGRVANPLE